MIWPVGHAMQLSAHSVCLSLPVAMMGQAAMWWMDQIACLPHPPVPLPPPVASATAMRQSKAGGRVGMVPNYGTCVFGLHHPTWSSSSVVHSTSKDRGWDGGWKQWSYSSFTSEGRRRRKKESSHLRAVFSLAAP